MRKKNFFSKILLQVIIIVNLFILLFQKRSFKNLELKKF